MIKAIFLDVDNTLLDFDAYVREGIVEGFREFNLGECTAHTFEVFDRLNNRFWQEIELGTLTYEELLKIRWNRIFDALGISFDGPTFEKRFKGRLFDSAIPVPGAFDALEYLHGKYDLYAASNGPFLQQKNRLEKGRMISYFSQIFISETVGASKPAPEFFEFCIRAANQTRAERNEDPLVPGEILMLGDSISSDMRGAVGSGLKTCYFDRNHHGDPDGLSIDYVIHSLNEIPNIL